MDGPKPALVRDLGATYHRDGIESVLSQVAADLGWLSRLISRRVPLDRFAEAFEVRSDDVKAVISLAG
jgi:hypothetical protein